VRVRIACYVSIRWGRAFLVNDILDEYYRAKIERKSVNYRKSAARFLDRIRDSIGPMPVSMVTSNVILDKTGLREMWDKQHPSAIQLHSHLKRVFSMAMVRCELPKNPAAWTDNLEHILTDSAHKVEHRASHRSMSLHDRRPGLSRSQRSQDWTHYRFVLVGIHHPYWRSHQRAAPCHMERIRSEQEGLERPAREPQNGLQDRQSATDTDYQADDGRSGRNAAPSHRSFIRRSRFPVTSWKSTVRRKHDDEVHQVRSEVADKGTRARF
jgi:hypothetical protein